MRAMQGRAEQQQQRTDDQQPHRLQLAHAHAGKQQRQRGE